MCRNGRGVTVQKRLLLNIRAANLTTETLRSSIPVISPIDRNTRNSVLKGAYDLLSKMNNNEEEGHPHG
jgi:hypothetical protein